MRNALQVVFLISLALLVALESGCGPYPERSEYAYLARVAQDAPPLPQDFDKRYRRFLRRAADPQAIAEVAYMAGRAYQQIGRWTDALRSFQRADRAEFPVRDYARYRLAESLAALGRYEEAIAAYRSLLDEFLEFPLQETVRFRIAEAYEKLGRYEQSRVLFAGLAKSGVFGRRARYHVGLAQAQLGQALEAFQTFQGLIQEAPADPLSRQALQAIQELTREHPTLRLSRNQQFYHGLVLAASGDRDGARELWEKVAAGRTDELATRARYEIGKSYLRDRDYRRAITTFEAALRKGHPNYRTRLEFQRILAVRRSGQRSRALRLFRSFLKRYPWSALLDRVMMEYGWTLRSAHQFSQARQVYAELIRRFPKSRYAPEAAWLVAWCDIRQGQYARAISSLNRLVQQYPGPFSGQGYFWLGKLHERLGHWESAAQAYRRVVEENAFYYAVRAMERLAALERAGRLERGYTERLRRQLSPTQLRESVLQRPPTQRVALFRRLGDTGAEIAELEGLRQRVPTEQRAQVYFNLADAYRRHGNGTMAYRTAYRFTQLPEVRWNGAAPPAEVARLLYPLPYWDAIEKAAQEFQVDPYFIAAMMREESRFQPDAVSWAGAHGLMQLMPATAKQIAKRLGIRNFSVEMLRDPEINIRLGTWYLRSLWERYGDLLLVSGAYNAGEGRMDAWTKRYRMEDIDEFVEMIPFDETRRHIKKVMHAYAMYRLLYSASDDVSGDVSGDDGARSAGSGKG